MTSRDESNRPLVYTIGHSNHRIEHFIDLLELHHIDTVADVRSQPYSRHNPQFCRDALRDALGERAIRYCFLGRELGGKTKDPTLIAPDGNPDWPRMAETEEFRLGLGKLHELIQFSRVAILCAEEDPSRCHRHHLVAPALCNDGIQVLHIRRDGSLTSEAELREREAAGAKGQLLLFSERG